MGQRAARRAPGEARPGYSRGPRHCPGSLEAGGHRAITGGGSARLLQAGTSSDRDEATAGAGSGALTGPPVPPSADPSARQKQPAGRLAAGGSGARAEPAAWHAHGPGPPLLSRPSCAAPPDTTSVTSDPPWGRQRCTLFPRGNRRTGTWRPSASCLLSCLRKSRSSSCARWSSPGSALNHGDKPSPQALGGAVTGRPKPPGEGRPPKPDSALRACLLPVPDCGVPRGTAGEALKAPTSCPGRHWEQAARLPPGL